MGHVVGEDERELDEATDLTVLTPGGLEDELALPVLADGVAVGVVVLEHVADDGLRALVMAGHEVLSHHRLALSVEGLARMPVHIQDGPLRIAYGHGSVNLFCPIKCFHIIIVL